MCGVIGYYSDERDGFADIVNGLFQMQHRGQDACGVAVSDGRRLRLHKGIGYVREVFGHRPSDDFAGRLGCGHVRYPTQGGNRPENTQPHMVTTLDGGILALCSNGDIVNYWGIREWLEARGVDFEGSNDGEVLAKYIAWLHVSEGMPLVRAIRRLQDDIRGAYSAVLVTRERLFAFRDPYGVRPLSFGTDGKDWIIASETPALDIARMDFVDEVGPGEIITWDEEGMHRLPHPDIIAARRGRVDTAHCIFEHIYFSRPDSKAFGHLAYDVRKRIGAWLAETDDVEADVVVPVPDSSNAVALGYAQASGLPFEIGLIRNHYVGRTFISPEQSRRDEGVRLKFNPVREVFEGKRVVLVDDSIVRGTTSRKLARMVRGAGASEIHMRVGSPITAHSCFYGIDTPSRQELIGSRMTLDEIREHITADTLRYTTVEGLKSCVDRPEGFCFACFDGKYPIAVAEEKRMELVEAGT